MKPAALRARVIAEWRGYKEKPFPRDTSQPVGALLGAVMKELGLSDRIKEEEILAAWRSVVGDFIAQHSTPSRHVDGVLHVRVLQPTMLYELDRTMRPEILRKLKQRFGRAIRDVKFRVG
jgi:predicted nucleic acid-binding Zn ribbon protein